jgi:hypothetical protein
MAAEKSYEDEGNGDENGISTEARAESHVLQRSGREKAVQELPGSERYQL